MKRSGITALEMIVVLVLIAIVAAICIPNFLEPSRRSPVSRVKADMRSIAALEAYCADQGRFPEWRGEMYVTRLTTPIA